MKANCKQCGDEFSYFPSQKSGLFCSVKCTHDYRSLLIMESGTATKYNALTYLNRFKEYECSECKISDWNNKPLTLQIDHIDGDRNNNIINNVRWLCPNCHTQTQTWGVRNASPDGLVRLENARPGFKQNSRAYLSIEQLENIK